MEAYNQTSANLSDMGQNLYSLFRDKNIVIYPNVDVRKCLLNAAAIESPRGFKIGQTASRKIDLTIALAMACIAAVREENAGLGTFNFYRESAERVARGLDPFPPDTTYSDAYETEGARLSEICNGCRFCIPLSSAPTLTAVHSGDSTRSVFSNRKK